MLKHYILFLKQMKRIILRHNRVKSVYEERQIYNSKQRSDKYMKIIRQSRADLVESARKKQVVIFGAEAIAMRLLNMVDITDRVSFFCDNRPSKIGQKLYGKEICSPDALKDVTPQNCIIVIASYEHQIEIAEQVSGYGDFDIYFARTLINDVFEHTSCELYDNKDQIDKVSEMLIDSTSKYIYCEAIRRRMLYGECDFSDLIIYGDNEYILPQMFSEKGPDNEIIIDCGAYTGDTLELFAREFADRVRKIWLFECGTEQLRKLEQRADRMRKSNGQVELVIMPYGVSDKEEHVTFMQPSAGVAAFVADNRPYSQRMNYNSEIYDVKTVALDSVIPMDEPVSFIKMDIEGAEYKALLGASGIIKQYKPKLAISIYHSGLDYFRLALLIKKLVPEYKLAVRHHGVKHVDTDLYAWI